MRKLKVALAAMALMASGMASAATLPQDAHTFINLRYGGDAGQAAAMRQLAQTYLDIASAPPGTWESKGALTEAAIKLTRAETCVERRFPDPESGPAKVANSKALELMLSMQRILVVSVKDVEGWNRFVQAYEGKMPPQVHAEDSCD